MRRLLKPLAIAALVLAPTTATAQSKGETLTKEECSACHMAYQAFFLPKRSWQAIMGNLANHFGEDASLDATATAEIKTYLLSGAADRNGRNPRWLRAIPANVVPMRISKLPWFTREHGDRAVAYAKSRADIATISNCTGCHRGAASGQFDD